MNRKKKKKKRGRRRGKEKERLLIVFVAVFRLVHFFGLKAGKTSLMTWYNRRQGAGLVHVAIRVCIVNTLHVAIRVCIVNTLHVANICVS